MGRASRRKQPRRGPRVVLGAAWYSREQWHELRAVAADPDALEETYEAWVTVFDAACVKLRTHGMVPERVPIDVDELVAWCAAERVAIDGAARARFAALKMQERNSRDGHNG